MTTKNIDLANITTAQGFNTTGAYTDSYTGLSVSNGGDINGDGLDEVIIGAPYASYSGGRGIVYVIWGNKNISQSVNLNSINYSAPRDRVLEQA